jgi:hypothetical protein
MNGIEEFQQRPKPNLIPLKRAPLDDEPPLPAYIRDGEYEELGSEVSWEWDPVNAWECVEGVLLSKTAMRLGGTAYTLAVDIDEDGKEISSLLLKKGGRILDSCMRGVDVGDRVYIRFRGFLQPKPGQHPARDWRVLKGKHA